MLRLLERNITSIERRLVLLAPPSSVVPPSFKKLECDPARHSQLVREMQTLRGSIYLQDGALQPHQLSSDGLHRTPEDDRSWHLLMLNRAQQVSSCVWYMEHDGATSIDQLRVKTCPMTADPVKGTLLRTAVEDELTRAREHGLHYAEVGGWAVSKASRCSSEGLLLALAAYSLGRFFGGSLGLTTATVRHSSSTILRRLGGAHLEADGAPVRPYFDPRYKCEMELLRFDSRQPNPKYVPLIEHLRQRLAHVAVISGANQGIDGAMPSFAA